MRKFIFLFYSGLVSC